MPAPIATARRLVVVVVAGGIALAACGGGNGDVRSGATTPSTVATRSSVGASTTAAPTTTASTTASTAGSGVTVAPAPWQLASAISREVLVTDGKDLYVAGGLDANDTSSAAVVRVDPTSGRASAAGTLTIPVHDAMGVWRSGDIVVVAGGTPPIRTEVQAVTPGGASRVVGRIPEPRADHVVAEVGGTLYALGGGDEASRLVGSVVASDDGGATWKTAGTLAEAVRYPAMAVIDGSVYLFGGVSTMGGTDTASVQRYDPKTQQTTVVAKLPGPLSHATAVPLGGAVFLAGGYVDNRLGAQIWRFDPKGNTTADAGAALPAPLSDSAAVVLDGTGYLVGGEAATKKSVTTVSLLRMR